MKSSIVSAPQRQQRRPNLIYILNDDTDVLLGSASTPIRPIG